MKPLAKNIQIKKTIIARPTVSQLYIIYEYRIIRIGPKKHVQDQICESDTFKSFETLKYMGKQNLIILEENCASDSFQALWSFKAKTYAQDQICNVGTFKTFGTFKEIENSIYTWNTGQ